MSQPLEFKISEEYAGWRADKALATVEVIGTRTRAAKLIQDKCITLKGKPIKASLKVEEGDLLCITLPEPKPVELLPYDFPLDIIYEDNDIIVINKPAGLVVHPASGHEQDTLVNALLHHAKDLSMGFEESRPGIVHRLDKATSGLIVVAKNNVAHEHLSAQFKNKSAYRIYKALTYGRPSPEVGTCESFIGRHPHHRKKMTSLPVIENETPRGKWAITHYKTIETHSSTISLVECQLETGRTHQIRVHLSEIQNQILADPVYGGLSRAKNLKSVKLRQLIQDLNRVALHASYLGLVHPTTGENLEFHAPCPDDLKQIVDLLGFQDYDARPISK